MFTVIAIVLGVGFFVVPALVIVGGAVSGISERNRIDRICKSLDDEISRSEGRL